MSNTINDYKTAEKIKKLIKKQYMSENIHILKSANLDSNKKEYYILKVFSIVFLGSELEKIKTIFKTVVDYKPVMIFNTQGGELMLTLI